MPRRTPGPCVAWPLLPRDHRPSDTRACGGRALRATSNTDSCWRPAPHDDLFPGPTTGEFVAGATRVASISYAVNDDEIRVRIALANGPRGLIFRALIAGHGRRAGPELDHDISFAGASFDGFKIPAAHDEICAKFPERRAGRRQIFVRCRSA